MKKIIFIALAALMMVGCYNPPDYQSNPPDYQRIDKWQILELDSCEYIQADGYKGVCSQRQLPFLQGTQAEGTGGVGN